MVLLASLNLKGGRHQQEAEEPVQLDALSGEVVEIEWRARRPPSTR
jgi:hypothetical protein